MKRLSPVDCGSLSFFLRSWFSIVISTIIPSIYRLMNKLLWSIKIGLAVFIGVYVKRREVSVIQFFAIFTSGNFWLLKTMCLTNGISGGKYFIEFGCLSGKWCVAERNIQHSMVAYLKMITFDENFAVAQFLHQTHNIFQR